MSLTRLCSGAVQGSIVPLQLNMMSYYKHNNRRAIRFTAAVTLFIWLLAVGVGAVNACVVAENHARHGHLDHHDAQPAKQACQDFCAAGQTGVVKQATGEPAHPDFMLVFAPLAWAVPWSALRVDHLLTANDSPWLDPPVFIRFLRLTI